MKGLRQRRERKIDVVTLLVSVTGQGVQLTAPALDKHAGIVNESSATFESASDADSRRSLITSFSVQSRPPTDTAAL